MLYTEICQEMDHINIVPQIIYMIVFVMVFPYLLHDCSKERVRVFYIHCNMNFYLLVKNYSHKLKKNEMTPVLKANDKIKFY